ncbi:MAG: Gfo/Idh/MocA family oxidoreductase [Chloroflexi bacterium]|nr:Gfo/Idh/MocA family oxidoreductase [Chloroflexota bacterium]
MTELTELAELYQTSINQRRQQVGADSIGWGILGASHMAERWMVNAIRHQPVAPNAPGIAGSWAVAVYSHNEWRAQQFARANQIPHACVNLDDLLSRREIQCIYVSSHPRHHFPLTMAALAAGKHVLCETPLALTVEEAQTMQRAADNRGLLLAVNHARRTTPALLQMRALLADQAIGDVLGGRISNTTFLPPQFQTWRLQANGGGVLFDRTIHSLDLLRFLLGDEIVEVMAANAQQILSEQVATGSAAPVEEDVLSIVRMAQRNLTFQLHDSFVIPHNPTSIEIYGTAGTLVARGVLNEQEDSELRILHNQQYTIEPLAQINAYWQQLYYFNAVVRQQNPLSATPGLANALDGIKSLTATLTVRQAIQTHAPMLLKL